LKTEPDNTGNGEWVLVVATAAVAAALFVPLPGALAAEPRVEWMAPGSLGAVLALALATGGFLAFRRRFWPRGPHDSRRLRNGVILAIVQALLLRAAVELGHRASSWPWIWWPVQAWLWTPWFLTTGLGAMLLGSRSAILVGMSGVLLLYLRADPGPLPLVGCLVASLLAILWLRRSSRRRVFRAGILTGVFLGMVALLEGVQNGAPVIAVASASLVPVGMGVLSAFAVLAVLPVAEWLLGEVSDVTLVEYGSEHRLLDQLKEQAPGTWHHSMNVSDLAEKAAMAIGARALFCKTAALYHDIGKLKAPSIFAENITGQSPHDELEPRVSAERIIEHVTYGLELARKHRLPKAFREIIAEHHGGTPVRFFFAKACACLTEGQNPESLRPHFSYPGPPPSSRESGIISLADMIEAATRSLGPQSEAESRAFMRKLIAERVAEGGFALCPLTLAELAQVEDSFAEWLKARDHHRPAYPKTSLSSAEAPAEWTKTESAAQLA
jgi:putative nucleotidyltransferase with HDIG domain